MRYLLNCLIFILIFLSACNSTTMTDSSPQSAPLPSPADTPTNSVVELPSSVEKALKSYLRNEAGIPANQAILQTSEAVDWSNACLDVPPEPEEMCAAVITPGYRVVFNTPQVKYEFHSDRTGQNFRLVRSFK